ncbi:hypothetical protein LTR65_010258 [Meristemomyces frigidus]
MAPNKVGYSQGGYSSTAADRIATPDKIKCVRCDKIKNSNAFAETRLKELKIRIANSKDGRFNAAVSKVIACNMCTGGQVVELHCSGCNKDKGLDKFSKVQRRTPDRAQLNTEPGQGSSDDDDSKGSGGDNDSGSDYDPDDDDDGATLAGTMAGTSLHGSSHFHSFANSSNGGVKLNASGSNGGASTSAASSGHPNVASPSRATSSTAGVPLRAGSSLKRPPTPPHLRKKPAGSTTSGTSKFAKIRSVPQKTVFDKAEREEEGQQEAQKKKEQGGGRKADPEEDGDLDDIVVEESEEESE